MNKMVGITIDIERNPGNFRKIVSRLYCTLQFCGAWVLATDDRKSNLLRSDSISCISFFKLIIPVSLSPEICQHH